MKTTLILALTAALTACQPDISGEQPFRPAVPPHLQVYNPAPTLPALAFGWKIGETIPYTDNQTVVTATTAPAPWEPGATYILHYYKGRLLKITAISEHITDDIYGRVGKEKFNNLVSVFTERYGKPSSSVQHTGLKLYQEADEFYQCLKYKGCGMYSAIFETPTKGFVVQLHGTGRGSGYIELTFEATEWSAVVDEIQAAKNKTLIGSM